MSCDFPSFAGNNKLSHTNTVGGRGGGARRSGVLTQQISSLVLTHPLQGLTEEGARETGSSFLKKTGDSLVSMQHICPDLNFDSVPVAFLSYLHCEHST